MSATKSTMMMAILALFLCMTSTVAADLYSPGNPFNCTAFASNCQALTTSLYAGKNSTYQGPSYQCTNSSNLAAVQTLCAEKVLCLATFLVETDVNSTVTPTTTTSAAAATPTGNSTTNSTTSAISLALQYSFTSVDVTSQLLAMYDTSKCSAAVVQVATSFGALAVIATVVSMVSSML
ncbi:hypothetical protein BGZ79_001337 [Entomortierella chlamydospora]|nr:hypothetical protein BGZ79_001337 [Entomortierella chlamydospora]